MNERRCHADQGEASEAILDLISANLGFHLSVPLRRSLKPEFDRQVQLYCRLGVEPFFCKSIVGFL